MSLDPAKWKRHPTLNVVVSDKGVVLGARRKPLSYKLINSGYLHVRVALGEKGVACHKLVHRLVAECFIPNPDGRPHVNHKDGNKRNNAVENLEWCTPAQNNAHAIKAGLWAPSMRKTIPDNRGEKNPRAKLTEEQVAAIRAVKRARGERVWEQFGISSSHFFNIRCGRSWKGAAVWR